MPGFTQTVPQETRVAEPSAAQLAALSGEYTNPHEPDTPISFYVQDGKLIVESERNVPTELKPISATEFSWPHAKFTLHFILDAEGRGDSVNFSDTPSDSYRRTGPPVHHLFHDYQRSEVMIPMRDGVKLHAVILKPADIAAPLPFLIQRTPYGADGVNRASFFSSRPELARDGYIYVSQDIRGRYKSEGEFVMSHPSPTIATLKPSTKAPTLTTLSPGCSRTSPATTAAPALSAPAIPASWP